MCEPKNVREAMKGLHEHDRNVRSFYDDPMTSAMGVPTDDFQEGFDKRERVLLGFIMNRSPIGSRRWKYAADRCEKYLP